MLERVYAFYPWVGNKTHPIPYLMDQFPYLKEAKHGLEGLQVQGWGALPLDQAKGKASQPNL